MIYFVLKTTLSLLMLLTALTAGLPRLLPSMEQIAFESDRTGHWDIYLLDMRTGVTHNLTRYRDDDRAASWSSDGTRLVFYAQTGFTTSSDIVILDVMTGQRQWLTPHQHHYWRPAWSPDDSQIAFLRDYDNIYVMAADGSEMRQVAVGFAPSWSPDGERIVYYTSRTGELNADIYTLRADGTGFRNLTQHPANDWDPAWSPDGRHLAFTSARHGSAEIYVMTLCLDDAPVCRPDVQRLTFHPATNKTPAWSPDGRYIMFESDRDGHMQIYMVASDCGGSAETCPARRLTWGAGNNRYPAWRP